uniref:t-SNARE coiled-coil homology domain-containing protein n=1 Tax=Oryctolagus cuniculus TaxID=9986 RepID=A0A5F9DLV9_RABIT
MLPTGPACGQDVGPRDRRHVDRMWAHVTGATQPVSPAQALPPGAGLGLDVPSTDMGGLRLLSLSFLVAQSPGAVEELLDRENKRMADSLASKVSRLKSLALDIDRDAEDQNRYLDGMVRLCGRGGHRQLCPPALGQWVVGTAPRDLLGLLLQDSDFTSMTSLLTGSVKRFSSMARSGRDNRKLLCGMAVGLIVVFFILSYLLSRART